jgi:hypothetical protein
MSLDGVFVRPSRKNRVRGPAVLLARISCGKNIGGAGGRRESSGRGLTAGSRNILAIPPDITAKTATAPWGESPQDSVTTTCRRTDAPISVALSLCRSAALPL